MRVRSLFTKRNIVLVDSLPPEATAMVQALYSRSPQSVTTHLEHVKRVGPEKFMKNFYVGYGHKSIGDCGTTSIFIENVSMLAAKAIQDWPLYNGQEASTRYLDFTTQSLIGPLNDTRNNKYSHIQQEWVNFYSRVIASVTSDLFKRHPKSESVSKTVYEKAIKARGFDIARGFLPAGATTYVSWHTNLRQAHDHLEMLKYHPLLEVQEIAKEVRMKLAQKYSSSFVHVVREKHEKYLQTISNPYMNAKDRSTFPTDFTYTTNLDIKELSKENAHRIRPAHAELPQSYVRHGSITFKFLLDYGSYRDLQRHRSASFIHPFLDTTSGFEPWYLTNISDKYLRDEAIQRLFECELRFKNRISDHVDTQYYIPMGFRVKIHMTCSLPSAVYIAELRSANTVHPTLRLIAKEMGNVIEKTVPGILMHHDKSNDQWSEKRGTHDIISI